MTDKNGWRRGGLALTALGALLVLISYTAADWYDEHVIGVPLTFGALHHDLDALHRPGYSQVYFDWLGWLALALSVALGVLANRRAGSRRLRVVAAAFGVLAAVGSYLALWSLFAYAKNSGATDVGVFAHASVGVYLALAGFLVLATGAVLDRSAPAPTG